MSLFESWRTIASQAARPRDDATDLAAAIAREASDACILTGFQNGHETITNSRSPNGTTIEDGFGVTVAVTGAANHTTVQAPVVTGPDGNGTVKVSIDTTGMVAGIYKVTITGRLLTQSISFLVVPRSAESFGIKGPLPGS